MKPRTSFILSLILLAAVTLSACQAQAATVSLAPAPSLGQESAAPAAVEPTPTQKPTQVQEPTAVQAPTLFPEQVQANQAAEAAKAYFDAVSSGSSEDAAELLSRFSLMVFQMTRGDAVSVLQAQKIEGVRWSDLKIVETQPFDEQTILVYVTYTQSKKDPATGTAVPSPTPVEPETANAETIEAAWPMRFENGAWLYNWNNLIDFRTMDADAQTMSGITIMPVQINRYSDRLQLSMLVQNRTSQAVVFGQVNETLGTFSFDGKPVVAEKTQWILNPLRSVPAAILEAKGLFPSYPDTIAIRKWNNYDVEPWFIFQLQ